MTESIQIDTYQYIELCEKIEKYWEKADRAVKHKDYFLLKSAEETLKYYLGRKQQLDDLMEMNEEQSQNI